MTRICPVCGDPLWEDATAEERRESRFCSPSRCRAWRKVGKATARNPVTGHRRMLVVLKGGRGT